MNIGDLFSRRVTVLGLAGLLSSVGLAGCGGGGGPEPPPSGEIIPQPPFVVRSVTPVQPQKKWTFLVYMNAANDLEEFGILNLNQMEQIGSTDQVNFVVQAKRIGKKYDGSNGDWSDTRRFYIERDNDADIISSRLISQSDEIDMGKAQSLQEFIAWGTKTFPAERYCLVLWNHGAGWRSAKLPGARRGISYDDATGSHIDTVELPAALAKPDGRKWDLLALDASLMQMAEVAYEVKDSADFITGSEESPPGEGYPYDTILRKLANDPNKDGRALAVDIVDDTIARFGANSDSTQSILDASRIAAIAPAVNALGDALLAAKGRYGQQIADARSLTENYAYPQNRDLIDFVRLLSDVPTGAAAARVPDPAVAEAAKNVENVVKAALVKNVNGARHPNSNGLSIFLPSPDGYRTIDGEQADGFGQRYGELAFTRAAPRWQTFLVQGPP